MSGVTLPNANSVDTVKNCVIKILIGHKMSEREIPAMHFLFS